MKYQLSKSHLGLIIFFATFFVSSTHAQNLNTDTSYVRQIVSWDLQRAKNLKSENGWLNLIGLFWLNEGANTMGSNANNSIVLDAKKSEDFIGTLTLKNGRVDFESKSKNISCNNNTFTSGLIYADSMSKPVTLAYKSLRWFIIKRGNKYGVRMRDLESEAVLSFKKIERFTINEKWKVEAQFIPYESEQIMGIKDVIGLTTPTKLAGKLHFTIDGKAYTLDCTREDNDLFIVFADETSGNSTYIAGRFLYAAYPSNGNKVILDFNKAYNPPCAFTNYATCPLPLPQNVLKIAIEAGEKSYGHH